MKHWIALCLACFCTVLSSSSLAAERVTFHYGLFMRSISLEELQDFAAGGPPSGILNTIIRRSGFEEEMLRSLLSNLWPMDLVETSDMLRKTEKGRRILSTLAQTVTAPRGGGVPVIAMRAAIVLSLVGDNEASVVEIIKNYPTEMWVNLKTLESTINELNDLIWD